ncbi:uncharacterized protein UDID_19112 [Ustilago sp. UG-2017a]|nr:uncharacterized protein UDID_19112 [Ustilago sp. UG-2017a]
MSKFVHSFVDSCETCRRIKAVWHKPYGHLKSLPVPPHPWSSISMDLIEQLPPSSDFTAILVVVDCLTKMAIFVPTTNELDAPKLAKLFLHHVYSKHGLPTSIVSDRGSEFTSHFWRSLSTLLGIENHFSSAYHPQSDGQTERINQVLEQFLRGYSNHLQTDWSDLLPLAEFSYNNAEHASTQLTPFFANYGYHPRFSFDNTDPASPALFPTTRSYTDQLKQLHEYVRGELVKANSQSAEQFDKCRLPAPQFRPGDRVWLSADNIRSLCPTKKLDYRRLGPFSVSEVIVRGRAPETQVGLSRYSVTIKLCDSYCLGISLGELIARRLSSCAMTAGGVCCICYRRFRLTSVDTPFRGGSARSVSIRRLR